MNKNSESMVNNPIYEGPAVLYDTVQYASNPKPKKSVKKLSLANTRNSESDNVHSKEVNQKCMEFSHCQESPYVDIPDKQDSQYIIMTHSPALGTYESLSLSGGRI